MWGSVVVVALGCAEPTPPKTDLPWRNVDEQTKLLKNSDFRIRALAAFNLGNLGAAAKDAVPKLQQLKEDPEPKVRKAAETALTKIKSAQQPSRP